MERTSSEAFETGAHEHLRGKSRQCWLESKRRNLAHDRMVTKPWVGDAKRVAKAVALFASEASLTQVHCTPRNISLRFVTKNAFQITRSLLDQLVLYKVLELASIKTREERLLRELEGVAEEHALRSAGVRFGVDYGNGKERPGGGSS